MQSLTAFRLILLLAFALNLSIDSFSQISTTSLVGYWPFSGNANDLSGNGFNGTVTGATLTTDRFGNPNSAYYFNGSGNFIELPLTQTNITNYSVSVWFKFPVNTANVSGYQSILEASGAYPNGQNSFTIQVNLSPTGQSPSELGVGINGPGVYVGKITNATYDDNKWHHVVGTITSSGTSILSSNINVYVDGLLISSVQIIDFHPDLPANSPFSGYGNTKIGVLEHIQNPNWYYGSIDDIRIYNRVLSQNEVVNLFNESTCYKTVSVTDTLIIQSGIATGLNDLPPAFGTVKIFPNPTSNNLTVQVSNPSSNYSIEIVNGQAQTVYSSTINQSSLNVNLSGYAKGLYYIKVLDLTSNILETKKLVIE